MLTIPNSAMVNECDAMKGGRWVSCLAWQGSGRAIYKKGQKAVTGSKVPATEARLRRGISKISCSYHVLLDAFRVKGARLREGGNGCG